MLAVRIDTDPTTLMNAVRAAVWTVDKNVPISGVRSMRDMVSASLSQSRPVTYAMLAGVVLVATTLATAVCAFRAAAIDPSRALREG